MKYTIEDFNTEFPDEDACLDYIFYKRFPDAKGYKRIKGRKCYTNSKGHQIYPLKGTVLQKSRTNLKLWFYAVFLVSKAKNGISAAELQRQLGITYKCAWRMNMLIRTLMKEDFKLEGVVECDESFVGGRKKKHPYGGKSTPKQPIMGMVSREGKARLKVIPNLNGLTVTDTIAENVNRDSTVITDDFKSHKWIKRHFKHYIINHSEWQYGYWYNGLNIHTNHVEGIFNHIKSMIRATYMGVSRHYLQSYLNQVAFHYNHRKSQIPLFYLLLQRL